MRNNGKIYITLLPNCLKKEICVYLWPIIVLFRLLSYSCLSIRVWTVVSVRGSSVLWAHYTSSMTPWWRHLMEAFPHYCLFVMGIHWSQGPMMRRFGVVLDSRLNKRLSKQLHRRWFETSSCLLWRYSYAGIHVLYWKIIESFFPWKKTCQLSTLSQCQGMVK